MIPQRKLIKGKIHLAAVFDQHAVGRFQSYLIVDLVVPKISRKTSIG